LAHQAEGFPIPFQCVFEEELNGPHRLRAISAGKFIHIFQMEEAWVRFFYGDILWRLLLVLSLLADSA
jgi:hypothetical protein